MEFYRIDDCQIWAESAMEAMNKYISVTAGVHIYDKKGNVILCPVPNNWNFYSAPDFEHVKVIAPEGAAREFFRDCKGTLATKQSSVLDPVLWRESEIARHMGLEPTLCRAWLWSAAEYGLTCRQGIPGIDEMLWVIE